MGRSDNIDDLLLSNMDWENDSLTYCPIWIGKMILLRCFFQQLNRETTSEKKRIFANPYNPSVCVILALAVYIWCKRRGDVVKHLFDGDDQNKRYYNILIEVKKESLRSKNELIKGN